jgi:hypothetical protein
MISNAQGQRVLSVLQQFRKNGAGIYNTFGTANLFNSTIPNNTELMGGGTAGGVFNPVGGFAIFNFQDTILAGNFKLGQRFPLSPPTVRGPSIQMVIT